MVVGRSCFRGARTFAQFERIRNLGPEGSSRIIDFNAGSVSKSKADLTALCWSYCCLWVQKAGSEQRFLVSDLAAAAPTPTKAMVLSLRERATDMGMTLVVLLSKAVIKTCLDAYVAQGGSFVLLSLHRSGWSHAIAIKLNPSAFEPNTRPGYTCAIFDPNVGQGVYSNHDDLAGDLLSLIQAYGMLSSIRAHVVKGGQ
jgi:hypothetical protein